MPRARYNEARSLIEAGLSDFSVSRATVSWGIPLPWKPEQTIYVWVDALLNYHTALEYGLGRDVSEEFWPSLHMLAKDILRLHCVSWPALLMAAGYEPPRKLFVHGYLTSGDQKMSKTLGNVIDPFAVIDELGADALRFYLLREVQWGQDGSVTREGLDRRYEGELANDLGNLVSRATAMIVRYREGVVPEGRAELEPVDAACPRGSTTLDLTGALEQIWASCAPPTATSRSARRGRSRAARRPPTRRCSTRPCTRWPTRARAGRAAAPVHPRAAGAMLGGGRRPGATGWERAGLDCWRPAPR